MIPGVDTQTSFLPMRRGIRQGSPLSPVLWIVAFDEALASTLATWRLNVQGYKLRHLGRRSQPGTQEGHGVPYLSIPLTLFADDITLISEGVSEMNSMLHDLDMALRRVGLELQPSKCVVAQNFECEVGEVILGGVTVPCAQDGTVR
eukprot:8785270-Alexandrium_andersonii.AAC.1